MTQNALLAIFHVLAFEGGYKPAGDPADPGGETNFGISKRSYPHLDIAKLTRSEAADIYHSDFWEKYQLGAITDPHVAAKVLDMIVNMGPHGGATVVQKALNALGISTNIDGILGVQTVANCNKAVALELLCELRAQSAVHYTELILKNPAMEPNLLGWLRRAVRP